jgi:hypothetical protein
MLKVLSLLGSKLKWPMLFVLLATFIGLAWFSVKTVSGNKVDFNSEVRPILNAKCTGCHGGVKKAGGISFIYRELALGKGESGKTCIVPGEASKSEFIIRLTHHDKDLRMPLGKDALTEDEVKILTKWINQGAEWQDHWSFVKPVAQKVPSMSSNWIKNPIDNFILAKIDELDLDLKPSPEAERIKLIRRVSLDLTGLPPTKEDITAFLNDKSPDAYEKVVDKYLASVAYGEKWAGMWLDLARFADTQGYQNDRRRNIWRYRDYVIRSFNADKPYDQFLIEQLAGDLMPNPNEDQMIATAFHRNSMSNDECGSDDEEFRVAAIIDRVNTTFDVCQGITIGCVQCHSHPYDPIDHKEYYKFMAFLNNTEDNDSPNDFPNYLAKEDTPTVRIKELMTMIDKINKVDIKGETYAQKKVRHALPRVQSEFCKTSDDINVRPPYLFVSKPGSWIKFEKVNLGNVQAIKVKANSHGGSRAEVYMDRIGGKKIASFRVDESFNSWNEYGQEIAYEKGIHDLFVVFSKNEEGHCSSGIDYFSFYERENGAISHLSPVISADKFNKSSQIGTYNGGIHSWKPGISSVTYKDIIFTKTNEILFKYTVSGGSVVEFRFDDPGGEIIGSATISNSGGAFLEKAVKINPMKGRFDICVTFAKDANGKCDGMIESFIFPDNKKPKEEVENALSVIKAELHRYLYSIGTPMMKELPLNERRTTQVFTRGNWQAKADTVEPGVPAIFNPIPKGVPADNRLGMAKWLVSKDNPLTARVAVNRLWEQLFGYGIVETLEDFGSQGIKPTHPELLDYMALKYMNEFNWSTKQMLRFMVTSATYRQSSEVKPEHLKKDARNRYLAHAPRTRLAAEQVRDQALAVSGLLSNKMYGPSVMPYQPPKIWQTIDADMFWAVSEGEDKYRRALYTYMRRTTPYPNMLTFDGPSREVCTVRRIRSNTPLQALATLNDTTFTEASQALAKRMMVGKNKDVQSKIKTGYSIALAHDPDQKSLDRLVALYEKAKTYYTKNDTKALAMSGTEENKKELASLTIVATAIINTDEFVTKE